MCLMKFGCWPLIKQSPLLGAPVMRYGRAARPHALNFRLVALKCPLCRPPNALSSVCVWPSMPPLCASFIQYVITLTGSHIYWNKCGLPTVTCLLISIVPVNKQIKSTNHQLMTLLIVYILDDTCEITCTQSWCSRHDLRSNNNGKTSSGDQMWRSIDHVHLIMEQNRTEFIMS